MVRYVPSLNTNNGASREARRLDIKCCMAAKGQVAVLVAPIWIGDGGRY